jgi:Type II secretion system (T2SS), protein M subtype b
MAVASIGSPRRIAALLVVALMVLVPALWIAWSLTEASAVTAANRDQADTLAALQTRLSALTASAKGAQANTASVYLPGKSAAIAGAALQRIVANTVEGAGGKVVQSEIARSETPEQEQGTVNLRAEFSTDIVGLQRIVFALETGAPILMVQAITVETADKDANTENPGLSVILLVQGHWEA